MSVTYIKLQVKPVSDLKQIVFNIECYGELFSGMAPFLTLYNIENQNRIIKRRSG